MINPYIGGYRPWENGTIGDCPITLNVLDMDLSGTKTYTFNKLGFRSEEFDQAAKKRIFFSGCSYTFGTGLNYEETAAFKFKSLYCQKYGLDISDVNLLNFAMPGASNDYIVRTMISQCQKVKPDVAVVLLTHIERAEYINEEALGQRVWTVAPWWIKAEDEDSDPFSDCIEQSEPKIAEHGRLMRDASIGYYYYYTPENAMSRFLQNALLLQYYFESNDIPYVLHWVEFDQFDQVLQHFALSTLANMIKKNHFTDFSDLTKYWCDKAADDSHPGPMSNTNIAKALYSTYQTLYDVKKAR